MICAARRQHPSWGPAKLLAWLPPRYPALDWPAVSTAGDLLAGRGASQEIADDTFDVMRRVHEIRLPTIAVCGAGDRLTPVKYHRYLQERIPGSRLTVIDGAGHWVFWEQPEALTRAVRAFLDELPVSAAARAPGARGSGASGRPERA